MNKQEIIDKFEKDLSVAEKNLLDLIEALNVDIEQTIERVGTLEEKTKVLPKFTYSDSEDKFAWCIGGTKYPLWRLWYAVTFVPRYLLTGKVRF